MVSRQTVFPHAVLSLSQPERIFTGFWRRVRKSGLSVPIWNCIFIRVNKSCPTRTMIKHFALVSNFSIQVVGNYSMGGGGCSKQKNQDAFKKLHVCAYLYVSVISVSQQLPFTAKRYKMHGPFVFVFSSFKTYPLYRDHFLSSPITGMAFTNNPQPEPPEILITYTEKSPDCAFAILTTGDLKPPMGAVQVCNELERPW